MPGSERPSPRDEFARLVSMSSGERKQELDRLWARDPDLAAEVSSLLQHQNEAQEEGFLPPPDAADGSDEDSTVQPEPHPRGSMLGPYVMDRMIGRGGMGRVYLAYRQDEPSHPVAVKVMRMGQKRTNLDRFLAEGLHLEKLSHPNIVRLLDVGTDPAGLPYIVMEYVAGRHLTTYCQEEKLSVEEKAGLVLQVARGVAYAHERRVLHGDLKPSNILVDHSGVPKITDFGLARSLGERPEDQEVGDQAGESWCHLWPGALEGKEGWVEPTIDTYALGMILYRLVTGRSPFQGETMLQAFMRAARQRPPRPRRVSRDVPRTLERIILKAMSRDKRGRAMTPDALVGMLEEYLGQGRGVRKRWWPRLVRGRRVGGWGESGRGA